MYQVYRNVNNGKLSIKDESIGLVCGHAHIVYMTNVSFVVNESARQRVLESKRKNVHAYVSGDIISVDSFKPYKYRNIRLSSGLDISGTATQIVLYNPYKFSHFALASTLDPIYKSQLCTIKSDGTILVN